MGRGKAIVQASRSLQFVRLFFFFFFFLSFSFSFSGTTRVHTDRLTDSLAVQVHTCAHMSVKKMFASQKGGDAPSPDESGLGSRTLAAPCD